MTRLSTSAVLTALFALALSAHAADPKELEKFQGTWKAQKAVRDGKEAPAPVRDDLRVVIAGYKLSVVINKKAGNLNWPDRFCLLGVLSYLWFIVLRRGRSPIRAQGTSQARDACVESTCQFDSQ